MKLKVAFLDVEQGDCAVVTFKEGRKKACIVVDGGKKKDAGKRLATYLKHEGIKIIDLLVGTHIDSDHIAGLMHFLKTYSDRAGDWNQGRKKCIRHYWGPKPNPSWNPSSGKKHVKSLSTIGKMFPMSQFIIQSVRENHLLDDLIRKHIITAGNIRYPSLQDPPPSGIFKNVELIFMAPDKQILDTEIKNIAMTITNLPYIKSSSAKAGKKIRKQLTLEDVNRIVAMNAEAMAEIADRTANNQSIVFKLIPKTKKYARPSKWSFLFTGDADVESWEMMRNTTKVKRHLHSRVLKVPHHGSINGIDEKSFKIVNPEYNIISTGQEHGIPDGQTLNIIKKDEKRKLFCTERNNGKSNPVACGGKQCIRAKGPDFRSIRFIIDTNRKKEKVEIFTINVKLNSIDIKPGEIWCQHTSWPNQ